jgi:uncharacterized membrane protein YphA (DoxX/SURF4 family)
MNTVSLPVSRTRGIVVWVLRILLAALFLFAGVSKLLGLGNMVSEFETVGLGQWFRYLTGILEIIGVVSILAPRVSVYGAVLLLCIDVGAFVAQVTRLHGDWIHTIVIGAALVAVIFLQQGLRRA